jgi:excisionase family DNA binding protein
MPEQLYYQLKEAARVLGIKEESVKRYVRTGDIPSVRIGQRKILVPRRAIEALAKQTQQTNN